MMKKLLLTLTVLFATSVLADDVGRVKLTLPQGTWITISTTDAVMAYGGDITGTIKAETTARALVDKDKNLLAILFVRAGAHGVAGATMNWNLGCKKLNTEYLVDNTAGSYTGLDCLRVWRTMSPEQWLQKSAAATYAELDKQGIKASKRGYQLRHQVGTSNGTFVFASAIIAHEALANVPDAIKGAKYAGMPGVAWGHLLADAVRTSTRSLSGELVVPQIDYR
jgi:hypothetical protein